MAVKQEGQIKEINMAKASNYGLQGTPHDGKEDLRSTLTGAEGTKDAPHSRKKTKGDW